MFQMVAELLWSQWRLWVRGWRDRTIRPTICKTAPQKKIPLPVGARGEKQEERKTGNDHATSTAAQNHLFQNRKRSKNENGLRHRAFNYSLPALLTVTQKVSLRNTENVTKDFKHHYGAGVCSSGCFNTGKTITPVHTHKFGGSKFSQHGAGAIYHLWCRWDRAGAKRLVLAVHLHRCVCTLRLPPLAVKFSSLAHSYLA